MLFKRNSDSGFRFLQETSWGIQGDLVALRGCGECGQDVILRQTPTKFTNSWGAGSIAPPLATLCLVPAWTHDLSRPPSRTAGQWYDKPKFHIMEPPLGRQLQGQWYYNLNFHTIAPPLGQALAVLHPAAQPKYHCNLPWASPAINPFAHVQDHRCL
eukprot:349660-Chlamydomonas_euryale.AAC.9